jgi:hypothetical protein
MELIERLPIEKIKHLNAMKFNDFKAYAKASCKNDDEREKQFDMLKSFCQTNIKCRGEVKRIYSYTQNTPLEVGGRLYCGNSLQSIPRKIRGFLLEGITTDLDMKNCHPVILRYLCKINKIHCPELEYYCHHRDEILSAGDRDKLKTMYLCAVNTDEINKKTKDVNFKKFDKECKEIQKKLTSLECYKYIVDTVPTNRSWNWLGSAINRILCVYENRILQEVINFLNRERIEICSLAFDGLIMYGNYYDNVDLIVDLTKYIETKFEGLNIQFDYKEHSDEITMDKDDECSNEWVEIKEGRSYEEVKEKFEERFCKITQKSIFVEKIENQIEIYKKEGLKVSYEHLKYDELVEVKGVSTIKEMSFLSRWFEDENINTKDKLGVYPHDLKCPDNVYNMWCPFDMELVTEYTKDETAIEFIKKHIKILCGNDENIAEYFEKWLAQMIQYPSVKTIMPTFISKEGAGKGTLLKIMRKMIGTRPVFESTNPSLNVWGTFNGIMANTFVINLNELSKKETMECEGFIKGLITDDTLTINEKGKSQYDIKSYHRFIATTNNEEPFNTSKDDRRNLIIRCSDELCGNKEYFNKFYSIIEDTNAVKSYYEYLKSIPDMDTFGKLPLPVTQYHEELKEMSENPIERWIKDFTQMNHNMVDIRLSALSVYEKFCDWISKNGNNYNCSNVKFGVRLKRLNVKGIEKRHTSKGCEYIFTIKDLQEYFGLGCLIHVE